MSGPVVRSLHSTDTVTGPLLPDSPTNYHLVLLIECVPYINDEKPSARLLGVLFPQEAYSMYPPLDASVPSTAPRAIIHSRLTARVLLP